MICPLRKLHVTNEDAQCSKTECAWWRQGRSDGCCAITEIAAWLSHLTMVAAADRKMSMEKLGSPQPESRQAPPESLPADKAQPTIQFLRQEHNVSEKEDSAELAIHPAEEHPETEQAVIATYKPAEKEEQPNERRDEQRGPGETPDMDGKQNRGDAE